MSFKNYSENYDSNVIKVCGAILDIKERSNKGWKKICIYNSIRN